MYIKFKPEKKEKSMTDITADIFLDTGIPLCRDKEDPASNSAMNLSEAEINQEYIIRDIVSDDEELKNFLFTLGCFKGEKITVLSALSGNFVISVKDARYSIDDNLAKTVLI